jgi:transcriptional regulator with XRE-family HTH domain
MKGCLRPVRCEAVQDARQDRDWTVGDVTRHTGVSHSTLFRWFAGDWQQYPELAKVCGLCAALDLPIGAAMRPLVLLGATRRATTAARRRSRPTSASFGSGWSTNLSRGREASDPEPGRAVVGCVRSRTWTCCCTADRLTALVPGGGEAVILQACLYELTPEFGRQHRRGLRVYRHRPTAASRTAEASRTAASDLPVRMCAA